MFPISADPDIRGLQGEHPEILAQSDPPSCWFERWRHYMANCGRMITDSATVTMEPIGNHHRSFEWCHRYDLLRPPFPPNGGSICPQHTRMTIYLRSGWRIHFMFGSVRFSGSADRMALFLVTSKSKLAIISNGHISATARHSIHLYSVHRAVIFAYAQLSCFRPSFNVSRLVYIKILVYLPKSMISQAN